MEYPKLHPQKRTAFAPENSPLEREKHRPKPPIVWVSCLFAQVLAVKKSSIGFLEMSFFQR